MTNIDKIISTLGAGFLVGGLYQAIENSSELGGGLAVAGLFGLLWGLRSKILRSGN